MQNEITKRVNELRDYFYNKRRVIKEKEFCELFGFDTSNWGKVRKGIIKPIIDSEKKEKLEAQGVNVEWLITGKGEMFMNQNADKNQITLRLYALKAATDSGECENDLQFIKNVSFDKDILPKKLKVDIQKCRLIIAEGESMEDKIHDGDILVYKDQDFWDKPDVYIVNVSGRIMVKIVERDGVKNELHLISENKSYPVFSYKGDELEKVKIIGKVIAAIHPY